MSNDQNSSSQSKRLTIWKDTTPNPSPAEQSWSLDRHPVRCFAYEQRGQYKTSAWKFEVQRNVFMGYETFAKGTAIDLEAAKMIAEALVDVALRHRERSRDE